MLMNTKFKGIIFDMDGTLTVPEINFNIIREKLGVPKGVDLLEYAKNLTIPQQKDYFKTIEHYEEESLNRLRFQKDVKDVLEYFSSLGIKLGIVTRNTEKHSDIVLQKLEINFNPVLTREFEHFKPSPEPIFHILKIWKMKKEDALIVGDFKDDIISGKNAGISTCFFENKSKVSYSDIADFTVKSYIDLKELIIKGN